MRSNAGATISSGSPPAPARIARGSQLPNGVDTRVVQIQRTHLIRATAATKMRTMVNVPHTAAMSVRTVIVSPSSQRFLELLDLLRGESSLVALLAPPTPATPAT